MALFLQPPTAASSSSLLSSPPPPSRINRAFLHCARAAFIFEDASCEASEDVLGARGALVDEFLRASGRR